jgi:Ser/Thr protein kinase RdoA (MazF antagonist)
MVQLVRTLIRLARLALDDFQLEPERLRFVARNTNAVFRVTAPSGEFALRLAEPGWRTAGDLRLGAEWQEALASDTDLLVPRPMRTRSGDTLTTVSVGDDGPDQVATLETWAPGGLLGRRLNVRTAHQFGSLFATMHVHGRDWRPSRDLTPLRVFEHMFSRDEPDVWRSRAREVGSAGVDVSIIAETADLVRDAYEALDRNDRQVIHCDLHHDNVKVWRSRLSPFDFEDTVLGYRAHDIAVAMLDLFDDVGSERYPDLLDAFQAGYAAVEPWPAADILPFQLGRRIWVLNWIARHQPEHFAHAVHGIATALERTRERGKLTRSTE